MTKNYSDVPHLTNRITDEPNIFPSSSSPPSSSRNLTSPIFYQHTPDFFFNFTQSFFRNLSFETSSSFPELGTSYTPGNVTREDQPGVKTTAAAVAICIFCGLIIVGTLFGNILVCLAVAITRKLRTPSNALIVSLAFSDLLIAITVMPFAVILEVTGQWTFGHVVCDIWTSLDVLLCTSSILNLCVISIDRYLVITRPFTYALKRTPCRMAGMVTAVWLASAVISIPPQFGWRKEVKEGQCVISEEIGYQLFATVGAFYLPLLVMIIIYTRIYLVSSRLSKTVTQNRQPSLASVGGSGSPVDQPTSFSASTTYDCSTRRRQSSPCFDRPRYEADHASGGGGKERRRKSSSVLILDRSNKQHNHMNKHKPRKTSNPGPAGSCESQPTLTNDSALASSAGSLSSNAKKFRSRSVSHMLGKLNSKLKLSSIRPSRTNSERKATRTLGVIMGSFTACWLPFFILALVKTFLGEYSSRIPRSLDTIFLWLGYANSFLNPIIYARFNRDFRVPFRYILQCRCRSINTRMRVTEFAEQFGRPDSNLNAASYNNNSQQSFQQRQKLLKMKQSQISKASHNKQSNASTTDEQQMFLHPSNDPGTEYEKEVPVSFAAKISAAMTRSKASKSDASTNASSSASRNLIFKHYSPQSKHNNDDNTNEPCKIGLESDDNEDKNFTVGSRSTDSPDNQYNSFKNMNSVPKIIQPDNSRPSDLSDSQQHLQLINYKQQPFNSRNSTPTTNSKSRTNHKEYRRPNVHNQYKLYTPKICQAPVVNMSMVIDDDDDDETDEEISASKVIRCIDGDEEEDDKEDNSGGRRRREESFNRKAALSGKSIRETRFPPLCSVDESSFDAGSNSSREFCRGGNEKRGIVSDPSRSPRRNNGVLKVFNASFNEINEEHSFVF